MKKTASSPPTPPRLATTVGSGLAFITPKMQALKAEENVSWQYYTTDGKPHRNNIMLRKNTSR
ncbi:MAG: hypothetical protein ACRCWR_00910 [Saezia sp.]